MSEEEIKVEEVVRRLDRRLSHELRNFGRYEKGKRTHLGLLSDYQANEVNTMYAREHIDVVWRLEDEEHD